jgi:hypothetical protein
MVNPLKTGRLFPVLLILLLFQSCAQMKSGPPPQATVQEPQKTSVKAPKASPVQPSSQIKPPVAADDHKKTVQSQKAAPVQASSQIKPPMTPGDYQKMINHYKADYKKHPQDQTLVKQYVKSLEEVNTTADEASRKEDFASAGMTYNILLKNYADFKGFAHVLSFDRAQLRAKVTDCKTALSKKGFQEYREGNLSEAISLWQSYLAIDPHNADIKKALNTAKVQQKNLQQTK